MNKSIQEVMANNPKYQAFLAAIEKRKAEIAANKAVKPNHEAVKAFTKLIERLKAAKEAAKETAE